MGRNGPWIGGQFTERPSAIFKQHVRVTPYPEDDIAGSSTNSAATTVCSCSARTSRTPKALSHQPTSRSSYSLPQDMQRRIMRENAETIFVTV